MSNLVESYYIDLLDNKDEVVRRLTTTHEGKVTYDISQPIPSGASITLEDSAGIIWTRSRFKIWHEVEGQEPRALGVFIPTSPSTRNRSLGFKGSTVELHDKTHILDSTRVRDTYSLPNGAIVTSVVEQILTDLGEQVTNISPSTSTLQAPLIWERNTPWLVIINELLNYIDYRPIHPDANGTFQGLPNIAPQDRPISYVFAKGEKAIHKGDWVEELAIAEIPNVVRLFAESNWGDEGPVGEAYNNDPNSDYSIPARGFEVVYSEDGVEAASPAILNKLAAKKLIELSSPATTVEVEHLVRPLLVGDVVRFISQDKDSLMTIERMGYTLKPGALCSATWQEVIVI